MVPGNKWEQLGSYPLADLSSIKREPCFTSESPASMQHLFAVHAVCQRRLFQGRIVQTQQFMADVKSLVVGIESASFAYDEHQITFSMCPNLTIENIRPDTIEHFVKEFLECGTCYKRLKMITSRDASTFKLKFDGFVFKVSFSQRFESTTPFSRNLFTRRCATPSTNTWRLFADSWFSMRTSLW